MATNFFDELLSNLAGAKGGGGAYGDLLNSTQQQQINQQAQLAMAAKLLQASGRSRQRISLGQALGSGLEAAQGARQAGELSAVQQLLMRQKLGEAGRVSGLAEQARGIMGESQPTEGMPLSPDQAISMGTGGPTTQAAAMIGQPAPKPAMSPEDYKYNQYMRMADVYAADLPEKSKLYQDLAAKFKPVEEYGTTPQSVMVDGVRRLVQFSKTGGQKISDVATPLPDELPPDIRSLEYILGTKLGGTGPAGEAKIKGYRAAGATNVSTSDGQKGFENEMKLGGSFKQEPIYKDFSDMQSSFGQVVSALNQGTPIGDVAGATKVMKLLDPGSVVRESELGIAMAAGGRMDRLQNYFSNMMSGQKLTPQQRDDFKRLSNELYAAAGQAYNKKRGEYQQFGEAYGFKNLNTVLGKPAEIPSIMRAPGAGGAGGAFPTRPSLSNIFNQ